MSADFDKSEKILLLTCTPFLFAFSLVIYLFKTGSITKDVSTFYGMLALMPFFTSLFVFSIITGKAPTKGYSIEKEKRPGLYYATTSFWGIMALVAMIYILKNI